MYAFLRALFDALLSFVGSNAGKGKQGVDADEKPEVLAKTGSRIREYIRLLGDRTLHHLEMRTQMRVVLDRES